MSYAVQVQRQTVRMVAFDGKTAEGEIYLQSFGPSGAAQTLWEKLNDPGAVFIPFQSDGKVDLVHLYWVAYFEVAGLAPEVALRLEVGAVRERAELELVSGETVRGELIYARPPESRRISDLLNSPGERFLLLVDGDRTRYLHRHALVRVRA
jgi:hypothetical protein